MPSGTTVRPSSSIATSPGSGPTRVNIETRNTTTTMTATPNEPKIMTFQGRDVRCSSVRRCSRLGFLLIWSLFVDGATPRLPLRLLGFCREYHAVVQDGVPLRAVGPHNFRATPSVGVERLKIVHADRG